MDVWSKQTKCKVCFTIKFVLVYCGNLKALYVCKCALSSVYYIVCIWSGSVSCKAVIWSSLLSHNWVVVLKVPVWKKTFKVV